MHVYISSVNGYSKDQLLLLKTYTCDIVGYGLQGKSEEEGRYEGESCVRGK